MPHLIDKDTVLCLVCQRLELAALKERSKFKRIKYDVRQFYIDQITDKSDPNYRRIVNNHYVQMDDENYEKLQRLHSSSSSINSSSSKAFLSALIDINLSKLKSKHGNKIKLENIATNKVNDTNKPKAWVPPKLDTIKIPNPKNKTTDV